MRTDLGESSRYVAGMIVCCGALFVAGLTGCSDDSSTQCESDSDCNQTEECRDGVCTSIAGDTDVSDAETGDTGDEEPMDTNGEDASETTGGDVSDTGGQKTDVDASDTSTVDSEEAGDADGGGTPPAALGESCSGTTCERGTCIDGTCSHVIATTNTDTTGNLGGVGGADQLCRDATKASLVSSSTDGEWKALISTDDTEDNWATNRVAVQAGVYNVDEELFAADSDDIWGSANFDPRNAIGFQLDGTPYDGPVWTGSGTQGQGVDGTGTPYANCNSWSSEDASDTGDIGESAFSSSLGWIWDDTERSCDQAARIYCINGQ